MATSVRPPDTNQPSRQPLSTATFQTELACLCCAEAIGRALGANPLIASARVNYGERLVQVTYQETAITLAMITRLISKAAHGCRCEAEDGSATGGNLPALAHQADMATVSAATTADRMQYVFPHTAAGKRHDTAHAGHRLTVAGQPPAEVGHGTIAPSGAAGPAAGDHAPHVAHAAPAAAPPLHAGHAAPAAADEHAAHDAMGHDMSDPRMAKAMEADLRNRFFVALALTIPTIMFSPLATNLFGLELVGMRAANWVMLALSTPVVWWAGWPFIGGAATSLRYRALNMSVLIATGVLAAWGFSLLITLLTSGETFYEAAAMLVTFVLFGHWMEMKSRRGTTDALRALFDLVPPTAMVIRAGVERELPTSAIVVGDRVRLRPGDKTPVDGVVIEGSTSIDESLVTGESLPVDKSPGDPVVGGSINRAGSVVIEATKVGSETALAQIVSLVEQAQRSKAPGQRLADRAAAWLVIVAAGSGIVTFLAWYFAGNETALMSLTFAISAVVIACPDALGLATPTAVAVGTGLGARHNILIKDAATLEGIAKIDVVVLDKTGTLTEGRPQLTDVVIVTESAHARMVEDELLRLVAAAEQGSEHPLARAIVEGARARGLELVAAEQFEAITGKGLRARVAGRALLAGNAALLADAGIDMALLTGAAERLATAGKTPMFIAVDGSPAGIIAVADTVKPSARLLIPRLRRAGIEAAMITGDTRRTAEAVARELGIERVFAEVLPRDKAEYVRRLQAEGKRVAMVGDGVNDAPALAQADVGIAIGAGTDVAIETARVVLMKSDPLDILRAVRLSRETVRKMKQNLFWASIYNVLAIPVAAGVLYPQFGLMLRPEWSALLMSVSSIIVATNAVLLRRVEHDLRAVGTEGER